MLLMGTLYTESRNICFMMVKLNSNVHVLMEHFQADITVNQFIELRGLAINTTKANKFQNNNTYNR